MEKRGQPISQSERQFHKLMAETSRDKFEEQRRIYQSFSLRAPAPRVARAEAQQSSSSSPSAIEAKYRFCVEASDAWKKHFEEREMIRRRVNKASFACCAAQPGVGYTQFLRAAYSACDFAPLAATGVQGTSKASPAEAIESLVSDEKFDEIEREARTGAINVYITQTTYGSQRIAERKQSEGEQSESSPSSLVASEKAPRDSGEQTSLLDDKPPVDQTQQRPAQTLQQSPASFVPRAIRPVASASIKPEVRKISVLDARAIKVARLKYRRDRDVDEIVSAQMCGDVAGLSAPLPSPRSASPAVAAAAAAASAAAAAAETELQNRRLTGFSAASYPRFPTDKRGWIPAAEFRGGSLAPRDTSAWELDDSKSKTLRAVLCPSGDAVADSEALFSAATVDIGSASQRGPVKNVAFQTSVALSLARIDGVLPLAIIDATTGVAIAVATLVEFGWAHAIVSMAVDERHGSCAMAATKLVEWIGAISPFVLVPSYHETAIAKIAIKALMRSSAFVVCKAASVAKLTDSEPAIILSSALRSEIASDLARNRQSEDAWAVCVWAKQWMKSIACSCLSYPLGFSTPCRFDEEKPDARAPEDEKDQDACPAIIYELFSSAKKFSSRGTCEASRVFTSATAGRGGVDSRDALTSSRSSADFSDAKSAKLASEHMFSRSESVVGSADGASTIIFDRCVKYNPCAAMVEIAVSPTAEAPSSSRGQQTKPPAKFCSTCPELHLFACSPSSVPISKKALTTDMESVFRNSMATTSSATSADLASEESGVRESEKYRDIPVGSPACDVIFGVFTTCAMVVADMICTGSDEREFCEIESLCDCGHVATDGSVPQKALIWDALSVVLALGATSAVAKNTAQAKPLSLRLMHVSMLSGRREHALAVIEGAICGLDKSSSAALRGPCRESWDPFGARIGALPLGPMAFSMRIIQMLRDPEKRALLGWGSKGAFSAAECSGQDVADKALLLFAKSLEYADTTRASAAMRASYGDLEKASTAIIEEYARAVSSERASKWGFIPFSSSSPSSSFRRSKWLDAEMEKLGRTCAVSSAQTPPPLMFSSRPSSRTADILFLFGEPPGVAAADSAAPDSPVPDRIAAAAAALPFPQLSSLSYFVAKYFDKTREESVFST